MFLLITRSFPFSLAGASSCPTTGSITSGRDRCCISTKLVSRTGRPRFSRRVCLRIRAEEATTAQFGHHQFHKIIQTTGQVRWHNIKAIGSIIDKPLFQLVSDLFWCTPDRAMTTCARDGLIGSGWSGFLSCQSRTSFWRLLLRFVSGRSGNGPSSG